MVTGARPRGEGMMAEGVTLAALDRLIREMAGQACSCGDLDEGRCWVCRAGALRPTLDALAAALRAIPSPVLQDGTLGGRCSLSSHGCGGQWTSTHEWHREGCWWPAVARLRGEG